MTIMRKHLQWKVIHLTENETTSYFLLLSREKSDYTLIDLCIHIINIEFEVHKKLIHSTELHDTP